MSGTLYALLVGIDDYLPPVPSLRGCANDIRAFAALLTNQADTRTLDLQLRVLLNEQATRQAVIDGFLEHLSQARAGDVALFYYSGHGSQERTPPEFWEMEPDHLDETFVCYDSRSPGNYDLADKELGRLIAAIAKPGVHVVIVLDCCHSGSGTRAPLGPEQPRVRRAPTFDAPRSAATFLVVPGQSPVAVSSGDEQQTQEPRGRHILLAACRDDEEAKEMVGEEQHRGAFSFYLAQTLGSALAGASYRDIFNQASSRVRAGTSRQSPVIEAVETLDLDQPFLGGAIQTHRPYFTAHFDPVLGWVLNAGTLQGIAPPASDETTVLALFPASAALDPAKKLQGQIGEARVVSCTPASARVTFSLNAGTPDTSLTYKAVLVALPLPPLVVAMSGAPEALTLVRQELAKSGPQGGPSLFVSEAGTDPKLSLVAREDGYRILRIGDEHSLAVDTSDLTQSSARLVVERLEHIASWMRVLDLRNPSTRFPGGSLAMDVFRVSEGSNIPLDPAADPSTLRVAYTVVDGKATRPVLKVRLTNRSPRRLYCTLMDLPETFSVSTGLLPGNGVWLEPRAEAWSSFGAVIPDNLLAQGVFELKDTLKALASTEECDATLLELPDLDVQPRGDRSRGPSPSLTNTFARLINRVQTRHMEPISDSDDLADWTTSEVTLTIVRPRDQVQLPPAGESKELTEGVTLMGHPALTATVRLTTEGVGSRDPDLADTPPQPSWLTDNPQIVRPFTFSSSRAAGPGLSILELREVNDFRAVTPESPLFLRTDQLLRDDETVLPYAFDGEFYLPLGFAQPSDGATEITLVRLPEPLVSTRSLTGSIRIVFKKIVSQHLGTKYEYPLLSAVDRAQDGKLLYVTGKEDVAQRVAKATRILLYIHGIIGDTQAMTASAFTPQSASVTPLHLTGDEYDLILAFDYENLNTPIEQTARDLKQRLAEVGLSAGHAKQFHVAAHSMGGLVARWFVEREGGDQVVGHLTMLGTPNGGSPWPALEHWFTTLLGIGLNGLSHLTWPPTVLGTLMRAVTWAGKAVASQESTVEVALRQMNPQSDFLKTLAASPDPHVPYSLIAGDTSIIPSALDATGGISRFNRLLDHLAPNALLHRTTALAFFGLPNDIAVSVQAIEGIPHPRALSPAVHEVPCDHVTYFSNEQALRYLAAIATLATPTSAD